MSQTNAETTNLATTKPAAKKTVAPPTGKVAPGAPAPKPATAPTSKQAKTPAKGKKNPPLNTAPNAAAAKASKTKAASANFNAKIAGLLAAVAKSPALTLASQKSEAKLYEIVVLTSLLEAYKKSTSGSTTMCNTIGGALMIAGGPASADRTLYSYVELRDRGNIVQQEAWISVQVTTLSWSLSPAGGAAPPPAGMHEMDVAIFTPNITGYPGHHELLAGFSCKHTAPKKSAVREALGFRRETAFWSQYPQPSTVPWLISHVPADPPSPIYLVSSAMGTSYQTPVDRIGVYCVHLPFP